MDELIGRLALNAGIGDAVAEKTIGIILEFLLDEGPSDKVQVLIENIPGAEAAIAASTNNGRFGSLMGGGLMALGTKLMGLGLCMSQIQNVARELFRFVAIKSARTKWTLLFPGHRALFISLKVLLNIE